MKTSHRRILCVALLTFGFLEFIHAGDGPDCIYGWTISDFENLFARTKYIVVFAGGCFGGGIGLLYGWFWRGVLTGMLLVAVLEAFYHSICVH